MTITGAWPAGMSRRELIVTVVCLAVIASAGVFITSYLVGGESFEGNWQCLQCEHTFSRKTYEPPPIACPKCGGQAVNLIYRKCPDCGKKNLVWRLRLTEAAQAHLTELKSRSPNGFVDLEVIGKLPNELQYRLRQSDGTSTWTQQWFSPASPEAEDVRAALKCSKCGVRLFKSRR